jgi:D-alanyl-D-alanine carboxypeptidase
MRGVALALASVLAVSLAATDPADARSKRHKPHRAAKVERYAPPYASIVIDANTGAVLQSENADAPRFPASLTKIMTLYLLFERMEAGKIKPTTELPVSEHASIQAPSKLALKPGETISVENAIRAVVTKSANDVAVVIAEAIGGSEPEFARLMTKKARELGMTRTTYHNASGLPNDEQVTTARDQALLGKAIQERFPKYYRYFSTLSFSYRGHAMRNHNKLLGVVEGVDGIKTGYTNASGFNLVTSMRRGGRHIVAAVFGGRTGKWRDARMKDLIGKYIKVASLEKKTPGAPKPAPDDTDKVASVPAMSYAPVAAAAQTASAMPMVPATPAPVMTTPAVGSTEPIKPNAVKTVKVKASTMKVLGVASPPANDQRMGPPSAMPVNVTTISTVKSAEHALPPPPGAKPGILGTLPRQALEAQNSVPAEAAQQSRAHAAGGWMIQVGAFDDERDAKQRLAAARSKAERLLGQADPFTERVDKGERTLFRARFAGLDKDGAESACKQLKRGEIPCMMLKN